MLRLETAAQSTRAACRRTPDLRLNPDKSDRRAIQGLLAGEPQLFTVGIDTSSVSATAAYLEFRFGAASVTPDPGTLSILGFGGDATLGGSLVLSGSVAGSLPGSVVLDNLPPPGKISVNDFSAATDLSGPVEAAVPEPGMWALFLSGLTGITLFRRR